MRTRTLRNPGNRFLFLRKRGLSLLILLLAGVPLFWAWAGFFFPDPYFTVMAGMGSRLICQIVPLVLLPLGYGLLAVILLTRNRELSRNLLLLSLSLLVLLLVLYPVADMLWSLRGRERSRAMADQGHSFLQLKPPWSAVPDTTRAVTTLFCLGGSTTEMRDSRGIGWPERVEEELCRMTGRKNIEVYNMGRQWYTTLHSLINYEVTLRQYHPEVIIVMHNINDFLQNADFSYFSKGPFREDYGHFYGPVVYLTEPGGLFAKFSEKLGHFWYHHPREVIEEASFPGEAVFRRNLTTLIELARLDGTRVILMSQPTLLHDGMDARMRGVCTMVTREAVGSTKQWSFATAIRGMERYNAAIRETAISEGVPFIDLEKTVPKTLTWFFDEVHYQDTTFPLISATVAREIIRMGLLLPLPEGSANATVIPFAPPSGNHGSTVPRRSSSASSLPPSVTYPAHP